MTEYCVDVSIFATFQVKAKSAKAARELVQTCAFLECEDPIVLDTSSVDFEVVEVYKRGGNGE